MPDRYSHFRDLVLKWQQNNYADVAEIEAFFNAHIMPDDNPDRLRFHVEMHRLLKLIKADLAMLKASRSADRIESYQQKMQERVEALIQFCQLCTDKAWLTIDRQVIIPARLGCLYKDDPRIENCYRSLFCKF